MQNLTKCEECIHEKVCVFKEGYERNVKELELFPGETQTYVLVKCIMYDKKVSYDSNILFGQASFTIK